MKLSTTLTQAARVARSVFPAIAVLAAPGVHAGSFECLMEPSQVVEIRSPVEGLIDKILVQRGDPVRKGQPLVELQSAVERSTAESARYRGQMDGTIAQSLIWSSRTSSRPRRVTKPKRSGASPRASCRPASKIVSSRRSNTDVRSTC